MAWAASCMKEFMAICSGSQNWTEGLASYLVHRSSSQSRLIRWFMPAIIATIMAWTTRMPSATSRRGQPWCNAFSSSGSCSGPTCTCCVCLGRRRAGKFGRTQAYLGRVYDSHLVLRRSCYGCRAARIAGRTDTLLADSKPVHRIFCQRAELGGTYAHASRAPAHAEPHSNQQPTTLLSECEPELSLGASPVPGRTVVQPSKGPYHCFNPSTSRPVPASTHRICNSCSTWYGTAPTVQSGNAHPRI